MNREIRFRVWDTVLKTMMPDFDNWIDFHGNYWTTPDERWDTKNTEIVRGHNYILMQFTGLTDKNGKDIYEGDIVRILYTDWPSQPAEKNGRYSMSLEQYKKSISKIRVVKYFAPEYYACNPETDS